MDNGDQLGLAAGQRPLDLRRVNRLAPRGVDRDHLTAIAPADIGQAAAKDTVDADHAAVAGLDGLQTAASMPALPVAETGIVNSLVVCITWRSMVLISSMRAMNWGSRWPMVGRAIAWRTLGGTLLGPGPISIRGVRSNVVDILASSNESG